MNLQPSLLTIHPAKAALLAQIRALEPQIARLEEEKAGCQYQIDRYYRLFRLYLGDLLTQMVELQMQLALRRATQTGRRSDAEEAQNWRDRFEQTNQAVREAMAHQPTNLGETDEHELRRLYRQAVTVAHPDRHTNDPDRTAQATAYMMQLNDAYKRRDLITIRRLVQELDKGRLFTTQPETSYDLDELQQWYQRLTDRQTVLQTEIDQLKTDDAYQLMMANTDLMSHFSVLRDNMLHQIDHLQRNLQSL